MNKTTLIRIIQDEISNVLSEYVLPKNYVAPDKSIIDKVISYDDAKKCKNHFGADWYYYRGFLVSNKNPEMYGSVQVDDATWLMPSHIVNKYKLYYFTFPAFYKKNKI